MSNVIEKASPILSNWFRALKTWFLRDWWVLLVFVLAAGLAMYPVLEDFNARMVGPLGDNVQYVYISGRVAEALRSGQ